MGCEYYHAPEATALLHTEPYDKTDDETRSILPRTRIWWPA